MSCQERRRASIESGRGLIEEDQLGIADHPECEIEAAPLAAGEGRDPRVGLRLEPDELDHLGGAVSVERLADREVGVDPGLLRDDPDPIAQLGVAALGIVAEHLDRPRVRVR